MTEIYGHKIDIEERTPGSLVTEVIIIARQVEYGDDGRAMDGLLMSTSSSTTRMVERVMLETALDLHHDEDDES